MIVRKHICVCTRLRLSVACTFVPQRHDGFSVVAEILSRSRAPDVHGMDVYVVFLGHPGRTVDGIQHLEHWETTYPVIDRKIQHAPYYSCAYRVNWLRGALTRIRQADV